MQAVKAVQIPYKPTAEVLELLETFRDMVNHCIRVGLEQNITSRFKLSDKIYHNLTETGLHSWYTLGAIETATAIIKNYRRLKRRRRDVKHPYASRLMAKLGNQAYKIADGRLRIPIKPRQYLYIPLHKRARQFLSDATLKLGSVTLTACTVSLVFSKTATVMEPKGYVAYDTNERSIDGAAIENGELIIKSYDLSAVKTLKHTYYAKRRRIQEKFCNDHRKSTELQGKYRRNEKNRTEAILHKISKRIVDEAKSKRFGIVLEDLKHIRKAVNRKKRGVNSFNNKEQRISINTKSLKRRLNTWPFRKLQEFIEYKAKWEGIPISYVDPRYTSRKCPVCGCTVEPNGHLTECRSCGLRMNRHLLAALNILKTKDDSLRFRLDSSPSEAVARPLNKAVSRRREVQTTVPPDN